MAHLTPLLDLSEVFPQQQQQQQPQQTFSAMDMSQQLVAVGSNEEDQLQLDLADVVSEYCIHTGTESENGTSGQSSVSAARSDQRQAQKLAQLELLQARELKVQTLNNAVAMARLASDQAAALTKRAVMHAEEYTAATQERGQDEQSERSRSSKAGRPKRVPTAFTFAPIPFVRGPVPCPPTNVGYDKSCVPLAKIGPYAGPQSSHIFNDNAHEPMHASHVLTHSPMVVDTCEQLLVPSVTPQIIPLNLSQKSSSRTQRWG
jgi:hypothetical protein